MVIPFSCDFSKNINVLRKQLLGEVNQPIIQVIFQSFEEIPHRLLRK
jgi:hypothetical protein